MEDILDRRSEEVFAGSVVLVTARVEPKVEDEVVEAIDKDQSSDTMKKQRERYRTHTTKCNRNEREKGKTLLTELYYIKNEFNPKYK